MRERSDRPSRLARRAAKLGWNIPRPLRDEMRDILAGLARDPNASPRDRRGAAAALMQAHRIEAEALRVEMEVMNFTALKAELDELREMITDVDGNGGHRTGDCTTPEDAPRPPPIGTDGGPESGL